MSYVSGRSTLGPRGRNLPIVIVRATPAMAQASRRALGEMTTDEAISTIRSEGAGPPAPMSMGMLALLVVGGIVAYSVVGGGSR